MPETAKMILARDLGCFDPDWRGWTLQDGELISREGWRITMSDVLSSPLLRMQLEAYKTELRVLRDPTARLEEQPLPDTWPEFLSAAG